MNELQGQIEQRLDELYTALVYSREKTALLTTGERICVNQERAALYRLLEGVETKFIQSEGVQKKIEKILNLIDRSGWVPTA